MSAFRLDFVFVVLYEFRTWRHCSSRSRRRSRSLNAKLTVFTLFFSLTFLVPQKFAKKKKNHFLNLLECFGEI